YGGRDAEVMLRVSIDGKIVGKAETLVVKPRGAETRTLVYTPKKVGLERGRFEIVPSTPDGFPDDDSFDFVLSVQPEMNVLVVKGNRVADGLPGEAHYLDTVLQSRAAPSEDKSPEPPDRETLKKTIPQTELTAEKLKGVSVVALANCGALSDAQY